MPAPVHALLNQLLADLASGQGLACLAGMAAFSGSGLWGKLRGRGPAESPASRMDPASRKVLQEAVNRRAALDVYLDSDAPTPLPLLGLDGDVAQVTVPVTLPISPDAVGRTVDCFFRLPSHAPGEEWDFYRFRGRIQGLLRGLDGELGLAIALPERVETGQKRHFFRFRPPHGLVLRLSVWPGKEAKTPAPKLPPPALKFRVGQPACFRLANISAGGLLLEGLATGLEACGLPLERGVEWYFLVTVLDPERKDRHDWWLRAALVNRMDGKPGRLELSFRLTGFASSLKLDTPDWEPVPEDGVQAMSAWIFQRTLELTRQARDSED